MKIILTTITIGLLYAVASILLSLTKASGETFASFLTTFCFSLLPAFICVCVFHLINKIFRWRGKPLNMLGQVLILAFIFNFVLFPITIPDFNRHQNTAAYTHYSSFGEYVKANMLESVITATAFAILIPFMDKVIRKSAGGNSRQQLVN